MFKGINPACCFNLMEDIMKASEKFDGYKELITGVWLKNLAHGNLTHMTQLIIEKGAIIPEHSHINEQTGYLISGSLRFFSGENENVVKEGESWSFASGHLHGAEAMEETLVIEVFSPPREDYLAL